MSFITSAQLGRRGTYNPIPVISITLVSYFLYEYVCFTILCCMVYHYGYYRLYDNVVITTTSIIYVVHILYGINTWYLGLCFNMVLVY